MGNGENAAPGSAATKPVEDIVHDLRGWKCVMLNVIVEKMVDTCNLLTLLP